MYITPRGERSVLFEGLLVPAPAVWQLFTEIRSLSYTYIYIYIYVHTYNNNNNYHYYHYILDSGWAMPVRNTKRAASVNVTPAIINNRYYIIIAIASYYQ